MGAVGRGVWAARLGAMVGVALGACVSRAALASPIRYSELSDAQLSALRVVGGGATLAVGAIGVLALRRYARQHREDGQGLAPWKVAAIVVSLVVVIFGFFVWRVHAGG